MFTKERALYHGDHDYNDYSIGYIHTHGNECGCGGHVKEDKMLKDEKTLNILLLHWVNHNESYKEGFREWVSKAKETGKIETAEYIEKAMECIEKANEMLIEAKKHM